MMNRPIRTSINKKSLAQIGIPRDFIPKTFEDFDTFDSNDLEKVKKFVCDYTDNITSNYESCKGIFFYGSNGQGKTLLSSIILKEAYRHRFTCRRCTYSSYLNMYTKLWNFHGDDLVNQQNDFETKFTRSEFLVLEEVGKEISNSISVPVFEDLLRQREDNCLPTIICTNLTPKDFTNRYGASIGSLVRGNMTPILLTGVDKREMFYNKR